MIRNNLSILMSERGVKNSTLSMKTGISKNTISSTAQNDGKMIQLETINKICQALSVTPSDFFSYVPYDIDFQLSLNSIETEFSANDVYEIDKIFIKSIDLDLFLKVERADTKVMDFVFETTQFSDANILTNDFIITLETEDSALEEFWDEIPTPFRSDITSKISKAVDIELKYAVSDDISSKQNFHTENVMINLLPDLIPSVKEKNFHVIVPQLGIPF